MPARPISYRNPIASRSVADRSSARHDWLVLLSVGVLMAPPNALANDCDDALNGMPMPADAAEVYRDDQVVIGGIPMCQLAYTTHRPIKTLMPRYERHWRDITGDMLAQDRDADGIDEVLMHSGRQWGRYVEIQRSGSGHAVMISIMGVARADARSATSYLPLPDGFELLVQQAHRDGVTVVADTPLTLARATERVVQRLQTAGWRVDERGARSAGQYQRITMGRGAETLNLNLIANHGTTELTMHRLTPRPAHE